MTLPVVTETLVNSLAEITEDKEKLPLIEKAHVVESVIDVIKLTGCLTVEWKEKLTDYHGTDVYQIFILFLNFIRSQ